MPCGVRCDIAFIGPDSAPYSGVLLLTPTALQFRVVYLFVCSWWCFFRHVRGSVWRRAPTRLT